MTTKNETQGMCQCSIFDATTRACHVSMRVYTVVCDATRQTTSTPPKEDESADVASNSKHKRQQRNNNATHGALSPAPFSAQERLGPTAFYRPERVHERVVLSFKVCPAFKPLSIALRRKGVLIAAPPVLSDADFRPTCACRRLSCPTLFVGL